MRWLASIANALNVTITPGLLGYVLISNGLLGHYSLCLPGVVLVSAGEIADAIRGMRVNIKLEILRD